ARHLEPLDARERHDEDGDADPVAQREPHPPEAPEAPVLRADPLADAPRDDQRGRRVEAADQHPPHEIRRLAVHEASGQSDEGDGDDHPDSPDLPRPFREDPGLGRVPPHDGYLRYVPARSAGTTPGATQLQCDWFPQETGST